MIIHGGVDAMELFTICSLFSICSLESQLAVRLWARGASKFGAAGECNRDYCERRSYGGIPG